LALLKFAKAPMSKIAANLGSGLIQIKRGILPKLRFSSATGA
jgi:hypothetical protein